MSSVQDALYQRLNVSLLPTELTVTDESHLHAGHAGASGGAKHFAVRIVSEQFNNVSRMARHRLVYAAIAELIPYPIHAVRIEAVSTTEI